jgi:RNA 2',3'-cyclic 3'-phosphodiesterase
MRIFFAVDPDEQIKEQISFKTAGIADVLKAGRAIDVFNLHVTVEYVGDADSDKINGYIKILDGAVRDAKSSEIRLRQISSFRRDGCSLIYLKAEHDTELEKIRDAIVRDLYFPYAKYLPHMTLFRDAVFKDGYSIEKISDMIGPAGIVFQMQSISLMESRRINGKLVYITLYERKI